MGHGGYGKRRAPAVERKKPADKRRPKALTIDKKSKANTKPKAVSLKNQIRSVERMLRKDLPAEVKEAQEKKLEELKKQQDMHNRLAVERKIFMRNKKIKFFERRKVERMIRRLERQQRASTGQAQETEIASQLTKLKEDLEYVKFFPKTEKYVSLFMGGDEAEIVEKRNSLRKQIKANLIAAAANGKELEETGSEDDGLLDPSEDDFFLNGSSSDEADADDEWSARDQASSASGKAASGMSSDERNQRQISARALMPPPGPSGKPFTNRTNNKSRFSASSSKKSFKRTEISTSSNTSSGPSFQRRDPVNPATGNSGGSLSSKRSEISTSSNTSSGPSFQRRDPVNSAIGNNGGSLSSKRTEISTSSNTSSGPSFQRRGPVTSATGNSGGSLSSNSDARKPRRKRRPKKKKQQ